MLRLLRVSVEVQSARDGPSGSRCAHTRARRLSTKCPLPLGASMKLQGIGSHVRLVFPIIILED
jgi:hypothetical protein